MNKLNKTYIALSIGLLSAIGAQAQGQSTYFLDNYSYNYRLNPAIMAERSFFGIGAGTVDLSLGSDLGLSSVLFPSADGSSIVTGLNSSVSSEEFLSGIKDQNGLSTNLNYNIFSTGIRKERHMTTVEMNLKANIGANVSGDLFTFLKNGSADRAYDFSSTGANINSYLELAVGHSRINEKHTFGYGFRIKGLLGLAGAQVDFNDTQITANENLIGVNVNAIGRVACPYLKFKVDENGVIKGFEKDETNKTISGWGAALDAGVIWKPIPGLSVSASINDLGFLNWNYSLLAESKGVVEYTGLPLDEDTDVDTEINNLTNEFKELANLGVKDGSESSMSLLSFSANAGVRYQMPFAKCISVGALATYRNEFTPYWEARFGASLTPCKWFSLTGNYGYGSRGAVCGGAMSVSLFFLNLFVAVDGYSGPIGLYENKIPYPVDSFNYRINLGLTIQFGDLFSK